MIKVNSEVFTVQVEVANGTNTGSSSPQQLTFRKVEAHDSGSFGMVYRAKLMKTGEIVAIKKVIQDRRYKNRELEILLELDHCNVVRLKYYFFSKDDKNNCSLNMVFDYFQDTLARVTKNYKKMNCGFIPISLVKLFMYQLFRGLAYIHSIGICHRDIKPQNLLINPKTGVLKICDFGCAKHITKGGNNVAYICARYYRAPELIFGSTNYTESIDIWSSGCVVAEVLLGEVLFQGHNSIDQMANIIEILGTPSKEEIKEMNPTYCKFDLPIVAAFPFEQVFPPKCPQEAIDLVSRLLLYKPSSRLAPYKACAHAFFNELRDPNCKLFKGKEIPPLFNFTDSEIELKNELKKIENNQGHI